MMKLLQREPTPEMIRDAQLQTEIGAYVTANWAGAYDCLTELFRVWWDAAPQVEGVPTDVLRALREACDTAMTNSLAARIPECGDFAAIAQNLSWALAQLAAAPQPSAQSTAAQEQDYKTENRLTLAVLRALNNKLGVGVASPVLAGECVDAVREVLTQEQDRDASSQAKSIRTALQVIRTWANVPGALDPKHVLNLCDKALSHNEGAHSAGEKANG